MGEMAVVYPLGELPLHKHFDGNTKSPGTPLQGITVVSRDAQQEGCCLDGPGNGSEGNPPLDAWLPITESRNGNFWSAVFHLLSSGIGFQALLLPVALSTLGWAWGIIGLSLAFAWQLYTIWILVQLHEPLPGTRYSRYLQLAIASFGPKLGKLLAIFPVMYLSGGTCVMLIITGGGTMKLFFELICEGGKSLTGAEWFLVFTFVAICLAQRPNLNSIAGISLLGAITAVGYSTLVWAISVSKGRPGGVNYGTSKPGEEEESDMARICSVLSALGIIVLSFRGHNLVLEIQGTLPSSPKCPSRKIMWRGVTVSYAIVSMCLFPLATAGFWAYGDKVPYTNGGMLNAFFQYHGQQTSKSVKSLIYLLVIINCLSSYQIYAMPAFDNLELRYTSLKRKWCPWYVRTGFRLFFGGVTYLIAVAFPFLPSLAPLIGGITLPLTLAYPCFMWIVIRKCRGVKWCINLALGCVGIVLSVLLVVAALWNLATKGLNANFFKPR